MSLTALNGMSAATVSCSVVDDRSFVRFGGLAAILLALTSWAAVLAYAHASSTRRIRDSVCRSSSSCTRSSPFWALFAIVAVYYRVRRGR